MTKVLSDPLNDFSNLDLVLWDGTVVKGDDLFESRYDSAVRLGHEPLAQSLAFLELGEALFASARWAIAELRKKRRSGASVTYSDSEFDLNLQDAEESLLGLRDIAKRASRAIQEERLELALQLVTNGWMTLAFNSSLISFGLQSLDRDRRARLATRELALKRYRAVEAKIRELRAEKPQRFRYDGTCLEEILNTISEGCEEAGLYCADPMKKPSLEDYKRWWRNRPPSMKKGGQT